VRNAGIAESSPTAPTFYYQHKPKSVEPNSIKINLTITDPKDLKVKPGDEVIKGQIISDRTTERQRLLNQRKQLELSLKKLTIAIPTIQDPNPIAKLPLLPPISYQQEQANIQLKEQQLKEAVQTVSNQQEKIDSLRQLSTRKVSSNNNYHSQITSNHSSSNQPSVNSQKVDSSYKKLATNFNYVDINGKPVKSNQKTFTIKTAEHQPNITIKPPLETNKINNTSNSPITVKAIEQTQKPSNNSQSAITINPTQESQTSNTNSLIINNINYSNINSKLQAIIEHETVIFNQLKGNQEKAKRELQIAKSQLETAKEQRRYAEHQLYLENNRRAIALQQQSLELERQRTIRAGQLQEQEYSKTQIEAKIIEIDNAINQLSTVKIPYNGTIKKVKWTGQTDHTLNVTVTLDVDDSSVSEK
jgi:hypothetical protein